MEQSNGVQNIGGLLIDGGTLIGYLPEKGTFSYEVHIPKCVRRIAKDAFKLRANVLDVYIPDTVEYIDPDAFHVSRAVYIYAVKGSYAHKYAKEKAYELSLLKFVFTPVQEPKVPQYRADRRKAAKTGFSQQIKDHLEYEEVIDDPWQNIFPKTLFGYTSRDRNWGANGDKEHISEYKVIMDEPGKLVLDWHSMTIDGYHGKILDEFTWVRPLPFENIPIQIKNANYYGFAGADQYAGMTEENWESYFATRPKIKYEEEELPLIRFGRYYRDADAEGIYPIYWYVLAEAEGHTLLLARNGLDVCRWDEQSALSSQYAPQWGRSCVKQWLNSEFVDQAFDAEEQAAIRQGTGEDNGVFCLSKEEVRTYLKNPLLARMKPTGYAFGKGAFVRMATPGLLPEYTQYVGNGSWWLRDETGEGRLLSGRACVGTVKDSGRIGWGLADSDKTCVRPAIWVSTEFWNR